METAARRALLGGALAGGLVTAGARPAEARATAWTPRPLPARKLKSGDLIVGPNATVVRVASRTRLASGRHRIRYTHPNTGDPTPMTAALDVQGFRPGLRFVVLLRDVDVSAVRLTPVPPPTDPDVIDGGTP